MKQLNDKQKRLLDQAIKSLDIRERKNISAMMIKQAKKMKLRTVPRAMKMTCGPQKMKTMKTTTTIRTVQRKSITPVVW